MMMIMYVQLLVNGASKSIYETAYVVIAISRGVFFRIKNNHDYLQQWLIVNHVSITRHTPVIEHQKVNLTKGI